MGKKKENKKYGKTNGTDGKLNGMRWVKGRKNVPRDVSYKRRKKGSKRKREGSEEL